MKIWDTYPASLFVVGDPKLYRLAPPWRCVIPWHAVAYSPPVRPGLYVLLSMGFGTCRAMLECSCKTCRRSAPRTHCSSRGGRPASIWSSLLFCWRPLLSLTYRCYPHVRIHSVDTISRGFQSPVQQKPSTKELKELSANRCWTGLVAILLSEECFW